MRAARPVPGRPAWRRTWRRTWRRVGAVLLAAGALAAGREARAQLISPGALARVHAELEGVRNCTQCHSLGQRGIDPGKCLSCHTPLRDRIRRDEGLHANVTRDCANCHADHLGRGADLSDFDEPRFRHDLTGYRLVGRHARVACRSCHTPGRITDPAVRRAKAAAGRLAETFLGLPGDCQSCHGAETPHTPAIATTCESCHTPASWARVTGFEHRQTGFALVGAHASASCASCHGPAGRGAARFRGLGDTCASCHASDSPHGRQFAGRSCASCHGQARWKGVPNFDHARTEFALAGAHASIGCASCHGSGRAAVWSGTAASCGSCHASDSPHGGQFGGASCGSCHGPDTWDGAARFRHDRTAFALTGAHTRADCASCHPTRGGRQQFADVPAACGACHDDAHGGRLGADCETCHATATWDRLAASFASDRFDHEAQTGFALVGAHAGADCASCHTPGARAGIAVRPLESGPTFPAVAHDACLSCHVDAHEGAFADNPGGADCASCHGQDAFAPARFDAARHEAEAAFALTGAHLAVPCSACHTAPADGAPPEFALAQTCRSCHADRNPHGDTFADGGGVTACGDCHSTAQWDLASFDHAQTGFPLGGAHAAADCASCHTRETQPDGRVRQQFRGLDPACSACHATPHEGQFEGRACDTCHDDAAFTVAAFDHEATAFPLAGAHAAVPCVSCHVREPGPGGGTFVRFRPLPTACADCHGS